MLKEIIIGILVLIAIGAGIAGIVLALTYQKIDDSSTSKSNPWSSSKTSTQINNIQTSSDFQDKIASSVENSDSFQNSIASNLAGNSSFQQSVSGDLASNSSFQQSVSNDLNRSKSFLDDITSILVGNTTFKADIAKDLANNSDFADKVASSLSQDQVKKIVEAALGQTSVKLNDLTVSSLTSNGDITSPSLTTDDATIKKGALSSVNFVGDNNTVSGMLSTNNGGRIHATNLIPIPRNPDRSSFSSLSVWSPAENNDQYNSSPENDHVAMKTGLVVRRDYVGDIMASMTTEDVVTVTAADNTRENLPSEPGDLYTSTTVSGHTNKESHEWFESKSNTWSESTGDNARPLFID